MHATQSIIHPPGFNRSQEELPAPSVASRIAAVARETPDRCAIVDGDVRITFAELNHRADVLSHRLHRETFPPNTCVGLLMDRSADFIVAALAVLKAGAAYLPLDSSTPAERVAFIFSDADVPVVLTHRRKADALGAAPWRVINVDDADLSINGTPVQAVAEPQPQNLAYVIYTSGSTGRPKGVEIAHANLCNLIAWHQSAFQVTAADRASHVAGLGFDAAGWEIWPHLTAGASIHIADEVTRRSPQALRDWLVAERITISFVPTVLAEQLLHSAWPAGTALRVLLTGADTLHRRPSQNVPFSLINNYGPTECTVVATSGIVTPDPGALGPPSIGKPILNTRAFILDDALRPVAQGEPGELCLAGSLVGRGYRNNPAMTASRFVSYETEDGQSLRIYRTGDRARLLPNGEILFLGRLDDQVKIRGYRIELGEIVSWLDRVPGIEASAVVLQNDAASPRLLAYVIPATGAKLTASDIREFLSARLPDYMVPAQFISIAALPLTSNGKLDKAALPPADADNQLPMASTPTADAAVSRDGAAVVEQRVAELVGALLNQPALSREANFFMVGGHSMLGAQLVVRIRDTFGVKLTLRQLFTAPTIAALSAEVSRMRQATAR